MPNFWKTLNRLNEIELLHEEIRLVMVVYLSVATAVARPEVFADNGLLLIFSSLIYLLIPVASIQLAETGDPLNWALTAADVIMTCILYWLSGGHVGYGLALYFLAVQWATTRYPQSEAILATMIISAAYALNYFPRVFSDHSLLFHVMGVVVGLLGLGAVAYSLAEAIRTQTLERKKKELLLKELKASFQQQAAVTAELERANVQLKQHALAIEQSRMELIKRNRELGLLAEILKIMGTTLELHDLLRDSLEKTVELMEAEKGLVLFLDGMEPVLKVEAAFRFAFPSEEKKFQFPVDDNLLGAVAGDGQPRLWRAGALGQPFPPEMSDLNRGLNSMVAAPLRLNGELAGVIGLFNHQRGYFTPVELDFFALIAGQLSLAVEKAYLYQQIKIQAITDSMTGLYNFRYFQQRLREEAARARRQQTPLSLLMVDLDWFKEYNDTFGHPQGDILLRKIARILVDNVREEDLVARYGGEEFVVILPGTGKVDAIKLGERLCAQVRQRSWSLRDGEKGRQVTCSIGVASFPEDTDNPESLVTLADAALYEAKRQGKDRVCAWQPSS